MAGQSMGQFAHCDLQVKAGIDGTVSSEIMQSCQDKIIHKIFKSKSWVTAYGEDKKVSGGNQCLVPREWAVLEAPLALESSKGRQT